jgi:hypothetical protein
MIFRSAFQTLRFFEIFLPMNPLKTALIALALSVVTASAALWKSEDFGCEINLPDSESPNAQTNWTTLGSTDEGTLVGARKIDKSAYVFLGYVDLSKRRNFHLNEKSIEELEKRFFGAGQGFRRGLERVSLHGLPGYRLTGDEVYNGGHYGLVVEMYEANGRIYEIAGMKEDDSHPLKDPDIKSCMTSFRLLR